MTFGRNYVIARCLDVIHRARDVRGGETREGPLSPTRSTLSRDDPVAKRGGERSRKVDSRRRRASSRPVESPSANAKNVISPSRTAANVREDVIVSFPLAPPSYPPHISTEFH